MLNTATNPDSSHWYILRVLPKQDAKTSHYLEKIGIEHYMPIRKELHQWSDRVKEMDVPILRPYIFVKLSACDRSHVFAAGSVIDFLRFNGQPVKVSPMELERIRKICNYAYEPEWNDSPVRVGDAVEIIEGALKGIRGLAVDEHGKWHMYVLIEALGRFVRFSIARKQLRRLYLPKA